MELFKYSDLALNDFVLSNSFSNFYLEEKKYQGHNDMIYFTDIKFTKRKPSNAFIYNAGSKMDLKKITTDFD